jgi:hypothetical protein
MFRLGIYFYETVCDENIIYLHIFVSDNLLCYLLHNLTLSPIFRNTSRDGDVLQYMKWHSADSNRKDTRLVMM